MLYVREMICHALSVPIRLALISKYEVSPFCRGGNLHCT
jgi:hypothetical protein